VQLQQAGRLVSRVLQAAKAPILQERAKQEKQVSPQ
jgi:hypothetical protein